MITVLVVVLGVVGLLGASCVAFVVGASGGAQQEAAAPRFGRTATPDQARARTIAMAQRVATASLPPGRTLGPITTSIAECPIQRGAVAVHAAAEVIGLPPVGDRARVAARADQGSITARWRAEGYVYERSEGSTDPDDADFVDHWRPPAGSGDVPGSTATVSMTFREVEAPQVRMAIGAESECLWPTGEPPATPR